MLALKEWEVEVVKVFGEEESVSSPPRPKDSPRTRPAASSRCFVVSAELIFFQMSFSEPIFWLSTLSLALVILCSVDQLDKSVISQSKFQKQFDDLQRQFLEFSGGKFKPCHIRIGHS
jgi:hypothetical protein